MVDEPNTNSTLVDITGCIEALSTSLRWLSYNNGLEKETLELLSSVERRVADIISSIQSEVVT